jgi:hypothetical protein
MLVPEGSLLTSSRVVQRVEFAALQKTGWYVPHWASRSWDRRWQWWVGLRNENGGDHFKRSKTRENFKHSKSSLKQPIEQGRR